MDFFSQLTQKKIYSLVKRFCKNNVNARVTEVNAYFRALEEILRKTTDSVRDQQWDIKDLQREVLGD